MKKVLDISMIISICDFVEAFTSRKTKILDGSDKAPDLKGMLYAKYPNDMHTVDVVLSLYKKILDCHSCAGSGVAFANDRQVMLARPVMEPERLYEKRRHCFCTPEGTG
jgi:hypothetical protein